MPRPRGRTKEIRCYIDPAAAAKFAAHFPMRNSFSWALQTAVDETLKLIDGTPEAPEVIRSAIRDAAITQRLKNKRALSNDDTSERPEPKPLISVEPLD